MPGVCIVYLVVAQEDGVWLGGDQGGNLDLVRSNIDKLIDHERESVQKRSFAQKFADTIAHISGSTGFVIFNALFFAFWIAANAGWMGIKPFDPYPYGLLTTIVSLEAIFLSIFVLVSQNRLQYMSDRRAELDIQVNLLTEYEVTRILRLVNRIADKMNLDESADPELAVLEEDVDASELIQEIEEKRNGE
jgi:uncharacterized membrane protein